MVEPDTEHRRTTKSLDKLAHLDKLKTRMESARDILREAEAWSTLESEITAFLKDAAWEKAAARLAEASKSMVVFQSTPAEYESRKALLVSLQNELEAALSVALKDVLAKGHGGSEGEAVDIAGCSKFYNIFETMDRAAEFRNYYFSSRRQGLLDAWAAHTGEDYAGFLRGWYGKLVNRLEVEKDDLPRIFPPLHARALLAAFLSTTIDALSPSLQARLQSTADSLGAVALPEVIRAYSATTTTARRISDIMEIMSTETGHRDSPSALTDASTPAGTPISGTPPNGRPGPHKRVSSQLSSRFARLSSMDARSPSVDLSAGAPPGVLTGLGKAHAEFDVDAWESQLFEPFMELQSTYGALEKRYLAHMLRTEPALVKVSSTRDGAAALAERASTVVALALEAISRCSALTHDYGAVGLIGALSDLFSSWLGQSRHAINIAKTSRKAADDELDLDLGSDLDYSSDDWAAFQAGLKALRACKDVDNRLAAFEVEMREYLATAHLRINDLQSSSSTPVSLVQQSTLNSSELQSLLSYPPNPLLPSAHAALSALTSSAQAQLQTIVLSPLVAQLAKYPSLPIWTQADKTKKGGLAMPTFSLSPTDTIARVSEGILNLLRVFEVYAKEDALGYSLQTLPFVDREALDQLYAAAQAETGAAQSADAGEVPLLSPSSERPHTYHDATGNEVLSHARSANGSPNKSIDLEPEAVISTWLSSLALSLLSNLTTNTLPAIVSPASAPAPGQRVQPSRFGAPGANQLSADLAYLSNAVRALDVEWEELERWRVAVGANEAEWREGWEAIAQGRSAFSQERASDTAKTDAVTGTADIEAERVIWRRVGIARGWIE
jgi:hypothetical protein